MTKGITYNKVVRLMSEWEQLESDKEHRQRNVRVMKCKAGRRVRLNITSLPEAEGENKQTEPLSQMDESYRNKSINRKS